MTSEDYYVEVAGPASLAELVAAIDPTTQVRNVRESTPKCRNSKQEEHQPPPPAGELATIALSGDAYAVVQYDAIDADTWPFLVTVGSRRAAPVRGETLQIADKLARRGWRFVATGAVTGEPIASG